MVLDTDNASIILKTKKYDPNAIIYRVNYEAMKLFTMKQGKLQKRVLMMTRRSLMGLSLNIGTMVKLLQFKTGKMDGISERLSTGTIMEKSLTKKLLRNFGTPAIETSFVSVTTGNST